MRITSRRRSQPHSNGWAGKLTPLVGNYVTVDTGLHGLKNGVDSQTATAQGGRHAVSSEHPPHGSPPDTAHQGGMRPSARRVQRRRAMPRRARRPRALARPPRCPRPGRGPARGHAVDRGRQRAVEHGGIAALLLSPAGDSCGGCGVRRHSSQTWLAPSRSSLADSRLHEPRSRQPKAGRKRTARSRMSCMCMVGPPRSSATKICVRPRLLGTSPAIGLIRLPFSTSARRETPHRHACLPSGAVTTCSEPACASPRSAMPLLTSARGVNTDRRATRQARARVRREESEAI